MDKYSYIQKEEGFRPRAYDDTRGIPTIGFGQRVDQLEVDQETAAKWLAKKADEHEAFLARLPWWRDLSPVRQAALLSMTYQMGDAGIMEFRHMLQNLATGNFGAAADAMLLSEWAKQTPSRAHRTALMIRTGEWPQW